MEFGSEGMVFDRLLDQFCFGAVVISPSSYEKRYRQIKEYGGYKPISHTVRFSMN